MLPDVGILGESEEADLGVQRQREAEAHCCFWGEAVRKARNRNSVPSPLAMPSKLLKCLPLLEPNGKPAAPRVWKVKCLQSPDQQQSRIWKGDLA